MRTAFVVALLIASDAVAQVPSRGEFWKGTHAFRGVLNKEGVSSVASFDELTAEPARSILIVLGRTDRLNEFCASGEATRFMRNGGAIMFATDRRTEPAIHSTFWLRVSGETIRSARHCYRENSRDQHPMRECPLLMEATGRGKRHPIFAGLPTEPDELVIATNLPSFFSDIGLPFPLANLPGYRTFWFGQRSVQMPIPFAFGDDYRGGGRYLALADHSLFINDMMLQPDTHNFPFAENVVRWLSDGGRRDRALLYEDGAVQSDFNVSLEYADPPVPPQEVLVGVANRFLGNLQREDALNRTLLRLVDHRTLLRTTIFIVTLALLAWGLYRFIHGRQHRERLPLAASGASLSIDLDRRGDELLAQGNLAEAARELARQTFASLGVTSGPIVIEADGWRNRRTWSRRVHCLWSIATSADSRVTARDLTRITDELWEMSSAVASGTLRLDATASIR